MNLLIWKIYAWIIGKKGYFKSVIFFPLMKMKIQKVQQYLSSMNS